VQHKVNYSAASIHWKHDVHKNVFRLSKCFELLIEMSELEVQWEDCSMPEVPVWQNCGPSESKYDSYHEPIPTT